jgi:hypothetical protein
VGWALEEVDHGVLGTLAFGALVVLYLADSALVVQQSAAVSRSQLRKGGAQRSAQLQFAGVDWWWLSVQNLVLLPTCQVLLNT